MLTALSRLFDDRTESSCADQTRTNSQFRITMAFGTKANTFLGRLIQNILSLVAERPFVTSHMELDR